MTSHRCGISGALLSDGALWMALTFGFMSLLISNGNLCLGCYYGNQEVVVKKKAGEAWNSTAAAVLQCDVM